MRKAWHFLFSIRASSVSISIGVLLVLSVCMFSACVENTSLAMSLMQGTVTGILAALILNIGEKYSRSIRSYKALQYNARQFYIQVRNRMSQLDAAKDEDYIFSSLWPQHFQLCVQMGDVLYKKDASKITDAVSKVISSIGNKEAMKEALALLDLALNNDI